MHLAMRRHKSIAKVAMGRRMADKLMSSRRAPNVLRLDFTGHC